eukprot:6151082-Amphidinium_carterae.1
MYIVGVHFRPSHVGIVMIETSPGSLQVAYHSKGIVHVGEVDLRCGSMSRTGDVVIFQSSRFHGSEQGTWGRRVGVGLQFHWAER